MSDQLSRENLKDGYNKKIRVFEILSIIINISLSVYLIVHIEISLFKIILTLPLSWIAADIISGLVHWFADSYGKVSWPVIGGVFIRSFLEHHVDPKSITEHDWVETNGANFFIGIPLLLILVVLSSSINPILITLLTLTNIWTALTNQFHKWAHEDTAPKLARSLQKYKVILNSELHSKHHQSPFDNNYNITCGHTNIIFEKLKIYRIFELIIFKFFKIKPHRNL